MLQLSVRTDSAQAAFVYRHLADGFMGWKPMPRENLLGEAREAAKMTIPVASASCR
jgi:hypothetical protein